MTPHFSDEWLTVYAGDCREVLPMLAADSVDCIVTSPPYWGLRDYGTATWSGGDEGCDHVQRTNKHGGTSNRPGLEAQTYEYRTRCAKCGATRQDSQLGLEATPELYVANLVAVFRELRRVLKATGTCWLNLGDSYAGGGTIGRNDQGRRVSDGEMRDGWKSTPNMGARSPAPGLKAKDLVGIPWRVAFALQADGWYLRSDIIWAKPNPMPESVTDRPTKAHEYLFLLTKSARYYYDADAVRESQVVAPRDDRAAAVGNQKYLGQGHRSLGTNGHNLGTLNPAGRNLRSVWTIATRPYPGAHFAVFPPELPERCIKAGSSEKGVCPECGAPWERVVERAGTGRVYDRGSMLSDGRSLGQAQRSGAGSGALSVRTETIGWSPSCRHETLKRSTAVVLDPFAGSGTVGLVANRLSRRAILIDLNPDYISQQMKRNAQTPLGLPA